MTDCQKLLAEYSRNGSDAAFRELVARYVDLVYSTALRLVNGDTHRAEDVAQTVFVDFARMGRRLSNNVMLGGWLHRHTCFVTANMVRGERRRQSRERQAVEMNALQNSSEADFSQIAPVLDEAINELGEADRTAILIRFFEQQDFHSIGQALGSNEDAARMRVSRALEKLEVLLKRRGVTTSAAAISAVLLTNAVQAARAGFAITISSAALASMEAGGSLTFLKLMTATKLKLGVASAVIVAGVFVVLFLQREEHDSATQSGPSEPDVSERAMDAIAARRAASMKVGNLERRETNAAAAATPEEIVTSRLAQYGRSRRDLVHALAQRHGVEVPDAVKLFFDAVEAGNWDDIDARFKALAGMEPNASASASGRQPGLEHLWPAIIDAYGAAEQTHLWPAQQFLDYGNAILDSLLPGMVYVGGTDNGRWIPEMLNDTSDGEHHVVITQNGLADATYLDYLSVRYGDQLNMLTGEESQRAFQEYVADAQKRLQHDQEFPDEPKQVLPGEEIQTKDGRVQVSGTMAVMAINERILQALMQKNPDLSFAAQESFPMKGTYTDAVPLGPLMELRADGQNSFTADRAAQSLDYWRTTAQQVLSDPLASGSSVTLWAYSYDVNATANLLAAHNYTTEAEQAYRLASQLMPSNIEAALGLSGVLARAGRPDEAKQVLDDFSRNHPDQKRWSELLRPSVSFLWTAPATPTKPAN